MPPATKCTTAEPLLSNFTHDPRRPSFLFMKKRTSAVLEAPEDGSQLNGDGLDTKQLLAALTAFKRGDFSVRLPDDWTGWVGK